MRHLLAAQGVDDLVSRGHTPFQQVLDSSQARVLPPWNSQAVAVLDPLAQPPHPDRGRENAG